MSFFHCLGERPLMDVWFEELKARISSSKFRFQNTDDSVTKSFTGDTQLCKIQSKGAVKGHTTSNH